MSEPEADPEFQAAVERIANKLLDATHNETIGAVQVALANIVSQLALQHGDGAEDRLFLETITGMFEVYRVASNSRLRNTDETVS